MEYSNFSGTIKAETVPQKSANLNRHSVLRKTFFILLVAASIFSTNAQDVIILKNGNEINAKVTNITSKRIKYELHMLVYDDPIYNLPPRAVTRTKTVARRKVITINYDNDIQNITTPIIAKIDTINTITTTANVDILQNDEIADSNQILRTINESPTVNIIDPINGTITESEQIKVSYVVSVTSPTSVRILVDGRPVQLITDAKLGENSVMVDIPDKDCRISIVAQNEFGASTPATVNLIRNDHIFKPSLYVLAIGVSNYDNSELRLRFPAKDASDFTQAMIRQAGLLYESVDVRLLSDRRATAENIRDGLSWLQRETTSQDIAMLFMAGHGVNDNVGDFFFMPVNADIERINATCVSYSDIKRTISAVAGKLIVFMDACHSGNILGNTQQRAGLITQAVSELTGADSGPVVFTSSTGRQFSLESPEWNNGAFTKALVEGLNGRADFTGRNMISINSLTYYIANRVKELTEGRQAPTTIIPRSIPDFPIAVVIDNSVY